MNLIGISYFHTICDLIMLTRFCGLSSCSIALLDPFGFYPIGVIFSWTHEAYLNIPRTGFAGSALDQKVYIIDGFDRKGEKNPHE